MKYGSANPFRVRSGGYRKGILKDKNERLNENFPQGEYVVVDRVPREKMRLGGAVAIVPDPGVGIGVRQTRNSLRDRSRVPE